jgi:hypothetical protein
MSGYRTPFYNCAIGNVRYSCHQWGLAADVFVDRDEDGMMDDLNRDGRIDLADADLLYEIIEGIGAAKVPAVTTAASAPASGHSAGGLAKYAATPAHGPFIHVDVRGRRARWGV